MRRDLTTIARQTIADPSHSIIPSSPPPAVARADQSPEDPYDSRMLCAALRHPRNLAATGLVLLVAAACAALGPGALAACVGMLAAALYITMVSRSLDDPALAVQVHGDLGPRLLVQVPLADIRPLEIRVALERLLEGHERLRRTLRASPVATAPLADVYQRCGDLVQAAGRLAAGAGPIHAQLQRCGAQQLVDRARDVTDRALGTADASAASAYLRAAEIHDHQLATTRELEGLLDRLAARLALAEAVLDSVTATAVRLDALEREARLEEVARADP